MRNVAVFPTPRMWWLSSQYFVIVSLLPWSQKQLPSCQLVLSIVEASIKYFKQMMGFQMLFQKRRIKESRSPMKYIGVWKIWALLNGMNCTESDNYMGDELHYMEHLATTMYSRILRNHSVFDNNEEDCFPFLKLEKPLSLLQPSLEILTTTHRNSDGLLECKRYTLRPVTIVVDGLLPHIINSFPWLKD